ncbi:MAG: chemotaxis protein CheX [Proteobacteria bacterium]|nr:MAG: chemotaxis protein CheX [Pseudomonadota bacterium]
MFLKPFLKKTGDHKLLGDVSGVIGVQSETFNGTLAISLGESIFVQIASKMLGEQFKVIDEGNVDLIGELANIILGQAKIDLGKLGYGVRLALPTCVWGKDHESQVFGQGGVCVVIPFECEFGVFHIEVMTQAVNAAQTAASKTA